MVDIVTRLGKGSPLTNAEVDANFTNLAEVSGVTGEPMGHEDRTTSTISFNASTRTFTIAPVASSFTVWCKGKKVVVSTAQTVTIPNTTGMYSIYYDANGVLSAKSGYFTFSLEAPTAYVYWNAATGTAPYFGDERHGVVLDWQTHEYLHRTRGAALASGFSASGYVLGGNGSSNSHAQITLEGGTFFDEDMKIIVTATNTPTAGTWEQDLLSPARIPVLCLSGTAWVIDTPTDYPLKQGTARPQYNAYSGGVWSTADVANNKYSTSWILATNNLTYPVIAIIGQAQNDSQSAAEAVDFTELQLPGFPSVEFRPLYKLIFQCADSCTNAVHASLVSITDIRSIAAAGTAASIVTDHGNLSGLSDDDHPQYIHVDTLRTVSAAVKASFLPSQTSNAGKFLQTDGTATSWAALTSGNVTTALGFTPYNATNPSGYISGITSGMVTTALGFTPYNATNPSGYVTAAGARGAISVTGAGSYDSATGVINIVGGVTSFNTRTGAITLSSADVTTALGFTPYNNTNPSGYITGITSTMVTTALGFTPYNSSNPNGYISSITSANVTTALGFTPYNATNPSGYITSSALSGYLTSASAASTYLPLSGGTLTGDLITRGIRVPHNDYELSLGYNGTGNGIGVYFNSPADGVYFYNRTGGANSVFIGRSGGLNVITGSLQQGGNQVLHAGNYNSYSPTLTGTGASGTWGISISGNAATATTSNTTKGVGLTDPSIGAGGLWVTSASGLNIARNGTAYLGLDAGNYTSYAFKAEGTFNGNIDSDRGQGVFTLDPVPTGTPPVSSPNIRTLNIGDNFARRTQLAFPYETDRAFFRRRTDGGWNSWREFIHDGNYNSFTPTLTGAGASGTWSINVTGNANSASTLNSGATINGTAYFRKNQTAGDYTSAPLWTESYGNTSTGIAFHISGVAGRYLEMRNNSADLFWQSAAILNAGNYSSYAMPSGSSATNSVDVRAPIFYDSSDTGYYIDPNSTNNAALRMRGGALFGPNTSWSEYLAVGGNGWWSGSYASVATTNGNLHIDAKTSSSTYLNLYAGSNVYFGNGAQSIVAQIASDGTFRSPIFYDYNNTGYYVDPNSTSNISDLVVRAGTSVVNISDLTTGTAPIRVTNTSTGTGDVRYIPMISGTSTSSSGYLQHTVLGSVRGTVWGAAFIGVGGNDSYPTVAYTFHYGGYATAPESWRAQIFYDSNDTGWYVDPNGNSRVAQLGVGSNNTSYTFYNNGTSYLNGAVIVDDVATFNVNGSSTIFITAAGTNASMIKADGGDELYIGGNNTWQMRFSGANVLMDNGGYLLNGESIRSPIFYDSNDTGYYCNPNSFSQLSYANLNAAPGGRTLSLGGDQTDRVYNDGARASLVINASYYPHLYINAVDNASNTNHGPVFSMSGVLTAGGYRRWGMGIANTNPDCFSWGYYDNNTNPHYGVGGVFGYTGTNSKMWLNTGGSLMTTGDMRAPIFYDSNDTAYYVDPNSSGTCFKGYGTVDSRTGFISTSNPWGTSNSAYFPNGISTAGGTNWIYGMSYIGNAPSNGAGHEFQTNGNMRSTGEHRASIYYDDNNTAYYCDPATFTYLGNGIANSGGHGSSYIYNRLLASNNGAATGEVRLQMWCSEPGNSWDWAGFGYNVDHNNNTNPPAYYFGRPNTSFGQAYMRFGTSGDWYFYNTTTSGTRTQSMQLHATGYVTALQSSRSPIFYDSDNTGYYADLNSTGDSIRAAGNITAYYSDMRLKTHLGKIENAREKVRQLEGFYYEANELAQSFGYKPRREVGVSAQAVQAVLPEIVSDAPINSNYLTIDYERLTPLLIEAMKEQDQEVTDLRNRVAHLESLINKLIGD